MCGIAPEATTKASGQPPLIILRRTIHDSQVLVDLVNRDFTLNHGFKPLRKVTVEIDLSVKRNVDDVQLLSPDWSEYGPMPAEWSVSSQSHVNIKLPELDVYSMILLRMAGC